MNTPGLRQPPGARRVNPPPDVKPVGSDLTGNRTAVQATSPGAVKSGDRVGRWLLGLTILAAVLLMGAFVVALSRPAFGPKVGAPAPEFFMSTYEGKRIALTDLRGKVVILNFWASWCTGCEDEAKDLEAVWQAYRDRGVVMVGLAYTDTEPEAREYLSRFGITYPNGPDRADSISRAYRLTGVPETVVIDQAGKIVPLKVAGGAPAGEFKVIGPIVPTSGFTPTDLRGVLDRLIAEGGQGSGPIQP